MYCLCHSVYSLPVLAVNNRILAFGLTLDLAHAKRIVFKTLVLCLSAIEQ